MRLLVTAKADGIEPYAWRTDVLTRLPTTKDRETSKASCRRAGITPYAEP